MDDNLPTTLSPEALESIKVDWISQVQQGGTTAIILMIIALALLAFTINSFLNVRKKHFAPDKLAKRASESWANGDMEGVRSACKRYPSSMALAIEGIVDMVGAPLAEIKEHVASVAGREIDDQYERLAPFSIIGAIAPLLGLLGTMIGMIEAFQLVSIFGDDGGAAMLAGSISKALITTALGLIIAVPSLILYFYFKRKVHRYSLMLEEEIERLILAWFQIGPQVEASEVVLPETTEIEESAPTAMAENASPQTI